LLLRNNFQLVKGCKHLASYVEMSLLARFRWTNMCP